MKTILLKYGIPQEIVIGIMMLCEDTQSLVRSSEGDAKYFKITKTQLLLNYLYWSIADRH